MRLIDLGVKLELEVSIGALLPWMDSPVLFHIRKTIMRVQDIMKATGRQSSLHRPQEPSARIDKPYACMVHIPHKTAYHPFIADIRNGVSG